MRYPQASELLAAIVAAVGFGALLWAGRMARRARRDSKSGVLACAAWERAAARRLAFARWHHTPAALLMVDIDGFKALNDRLGHLGGDAVLADLGRCLSENVRAGDLVGRFGGDEFTVLLDGADADVATQVATRIHAVAPATLSIGIATRPGDGDNLAALLAAADRALYAAKRPGRQPIQRLRPAGHPGVAGSQNTSRPDASADR